MTALYMLYFSKNPSIHFLRTKNTQDDRKKEIFPPARPECFTK
jgi:hypothetical protein